MAQLSGAGLDYTGNIVRHIPKLEKMGLKMMKIGENILTEGKAQKLGMYEKGLMIEALDNVTIKHKSGNFFEDAWASFSDILMRGF